MKPENRTLERAAAPAETPASRTHAPLVLLGACAVLGGTIALLGGVNTLDVLVTVLGDGLVPLTNVAAATLGGMAIVRRVSPPRGRALLIASGAGLGLGLLLTISLLLGLVGALNGLTSWLVVGLLALGVLDLYRDQARWRGPLALGAPAWLWLLAAVSLGIALVAATMPPGFMWGDEPHGYDVLSYHLQIPREWYESGRIAPLAHNVFSYFPLGQETLSLLLMHQLGGPYEAMYAAQFMSVLLAAAATLAVFAAVRETHADGGLAASVAAVIFATSPWTVMLGSVAYNEPLLLLATALAGAWMLRALQGDWRDAALAGSFAGLGIASKLPAVPMLGVAGGLALLLVLLTGRFRARMSATLLAFAGGVLIFSLPWLTKNLYWIGNPVFPLGTGLFGDGGWDPALIDRWNRAHAPAADASRLGRFAGDVLLNPRYAALPIRDLHIPLFWPLVLVAAAWLCARRDRRGWLLAVWLVLMFIVWLTFTHLQGRFLVVALPAASILVGLAAITRRRAVGLAAATVIGLVGIAYVLPAAWSRTQAGRNEQLPLYGFEDLTLLTPLGDPAPVGKRQVHLVGEAKAFLYGVDDLRYRVVFNVPPAEGAIQAWLGASLQNAPDEALVVIDPSEVRRLSNSYATPPLEFPVAEAAVVTMGQIRAALARAAEDKGR